MIIASTQLEPVGSVVYRDFIKRDGLGTVVIDIKNQPFKVLRKSSKEEFMKGRENQNTDWITSTYFYFYEVSTD